MPLKSEILEYIIISTQKDLHEKKYGFENCTAPIIAKSLYQDRTNVSRILNELFREGKLIKKIGKPTIFISKETIHREFPFINIPDTLSKDANFEKYISYTHAESKSSFAQAFHIIGSSQDGSLFNAINKLMPIFFLPQNILKSIIIKGENGSGKKYIIQELFNRFIELGLATDLEQLIYVDYGKISNNLPSFINLVKQENKIFIAIQLSDANTVVEIKNVLHSFEIDFFSNTLQPIICFLYPCVEQNSELSQITPLYVEIPSFKSRPSIEKIDLSISFIKHEAERLQKTIKITKSFLETIITNSDNISLLQQNISYIVSRKFFESEKNSPDILLNKSIISEYIDIQEDQSTLQIDNINDSFIIEPNEGITTDISVATNIETTTTQIQKDRDWNPSAIQQFAFYLENYTKEISYSNFEKGKLYNSLFKIFEKKFPICDVTSKNKIINIILSIIFDKTNENSLFFNLPSSDSINSNVINIANSIEERTSKLNIQIDNSQTFKIKNILSHSFSLFSNIKIPILLVSRNFLASELLKIIYNNHNKYNCIYTYNIFDNSKRKPLDSITKYIQSIDKGKGVLLIVDSEIRSELSSNLFMNTKTTTYILGFSSFPLISECLLEIQKSNVNLLAITPGLVVKNSSIDKLTRNLNLNEYGTRATNKYLLSLNSYFNTLNVYEIHERIYKIAKNICESLKLDLNNKLILNFIFFMDAVLFLKDINYEPNILNHAKCTDKNFEVIFQQYIDKDEKIRKYSFSSGEIELLHQALYYQ
ncbi:hypothetical protein [Methanobrevibacter smithii]|uniref:hypothetical protein n=1 Tax=Methanobrevibacter smithii TaxID=2173 RepID=UPI00384AAEB8